MLSQLFRYAILQQLRQQYPSWTILVSQVVVVLLQLSLFYFTAKAFVPAEPFAKIGTYFEFVVIGHVVLFLPLSLLHAFCQVVREKKSCGVWEPILLLPGRSSFKVLLWGWARVLIKSFQPVLFLSFALAIFALQAPFMQVMRLLWLQLIALPVFSAIGLLAASIMLSFGRGERSLGFLQLGILIVSGAYVPIEVFPTWLSQSLANFVPYAHIVQAARGESISYSSILLTGMVLLPISLLAFELSLQIKRRRGQI